MKIGSIIAGGVVTAGVLASLAFADVVYHLPGGQTYQVLNSAGAQISPPLAGTSGSIGGALLAAGACTSDSSTTISGATTSMVAIASPTTYPGDGAFWFARVSASNTINIRVCASVPMTPAASTYNVRVVQ